MNTSLLRQIPACAAALVLAAMPGSADAQITHDGTASWPRTTAPGLFNASGSDKLVVVVSGEHNFGGNLTGKCNGITYNGQQLAQIIQQLPSDPNSGGHGQTHSSIWYLDNPGNYSGDGSIAVNCTGTSWVATAIGLSGTLPGVGPAVKVSGAASAQLATTRYSSMVIAAVGMGGQGNTASPLPGVTATLPSQAVTIAGLKIGSNHAGHAVSRATIDIPSTQTFAFDTTKTDLVTVAAVFEPVPVPITRDGSVSWPRTTAPGVFNASGSDKLVVVVSGEHNFGGNLTGKCNGITYNGVPLIEAVQQLPSDPANGGHGQTYSSIWYLDNPGIHSGDGTIAVNCTGTSWVATAVGLSGTLPGVGQTAKVSGSASVNVAGSFYGSMVISAVGMGGQGNTASPLPGVAATAPSHAVTIDGLKIGSDWAGHAVASATIDIPATKTFSFNTAKIDLVTVAAAFEAACPVIPTSPSPAVYNLGQGNSVEIVWANLLPYIGSDVWVDVWTGEDPSNLDLVISANSAGLNLTSVIFTAPAPGTYHVRIDSYLNGTPSGQPVVGQVISFEVNATGLLAESWLGLHPLTTLLVLQREGIAMRPPDHAQWIGSAAVANLAAPGGVRLRGLFTPETPGEHIFHIAGSQNVALWLSTDDSRFNKQRVAWHFEATGPEEWNKFPTQQSAPIHLEAVDYYIEAQVMNASGIGHLAIGWTPPGATTPALIPATRLSYLPADPADLNDNNLPDWWEENTGLDQITIPGAASEYGDPDRDGISNFDEFHYESNPLDKVGELTNGLTRETWSGISGGPLSSLTTNPRFYDLPTEILHVPGIDDANRGTQYGSRYRGFLIAPKDGTYRFWITGNDEVQLWLADGTVAPLGDPAPRQPRTDRFGKRLIAWNETILHNYAWPARNNFDYTPGQRSQVIHLVENQRYYIEVLHKQGWGAGDDHVSLAWQPPGQAREIIPATAFIADIPHDDDLDDDGLPDSWQNHSDNNLDDPALTAVQRGQFGDPDGDGLINLLEYQYGTKPRNADTDSDGYSDYDEIFHYGTDPLLSNNLEIIPLPPENQPTPHQYDLAATTGGWTHNPDGSLSAWDRRGEISYTFTLDQDGIHEIILTGAAIGSVRPVERLPLVLSLNGGPPFASKELLSGNGGQGTIRAITPILKAGAHTLTILHDNYLAARRLRLDSIEIFRLGGDDISGIIGIPDWAEQNAASANRLTHAPATSRTSPLSIEGITQSLANAALHYIPHGGTEALPLELTASINDTFFTDVPLSEDGPVNLTATFLGGIIEDSVNITWIPTNLLEYHEAVMHIRKGDALLLTAHDPAAPPAGTYTIEGNAGVPSAPIGPANSTEPVALTYDIAGAHTLTVIWTPLEGPAQPATVTIHVHEADLGPTFSVRAHAPVVWSPPVLDPFHLIETDDRLTLVETTADPAAGPRTFRAAVNDAVNRHVIARLPHDIDGAPDAILSRATAYGFYLAYLDETGDGEVIHRYDDGTWLMRGTMVAVNLPADVLIRLTAIMQGTIFHNGDNTLWLDASRFNPNGITTIYYEWAGDGEPRLCNYMNIFIQPD